MNNLIFSNEKINELTFKRINNSNEECLKAAKDLLAIKIILIKFDLDVENNMSGVDTDQLADITGDKYIKLDHLECYLNPVRSFLTKTSEEISDKIICNFVAKYSLQFFKDMVGVYSEKKSTLRHYKNCDMHSFFICDSNQLVISMIVFNLADDLMQTHYQIVKDIRYIFSKWIESKPEVKNASIMLHNYAAKAFGNFRWYTSPLSKMGEILEKSGQNFSIIPYDDVSDWIYMLSIKYNCGELFRINKEREIYCIDIQK